MPELLVRLVVVLAVITLATLAGRAWNRRQSRIRTPVGGFAAADLVKVGLDAPEAEAVALLLGSPTCAPCVSVKAILAEVASERPRFRWTYADAADHLDLAAAHHVLRVPTLFVLDPGGRILARTSGVPAKRDLIRVIERQGDLTAAS